MTEVEFRNGPRLVPDHVAAMMNGLETYKMTYEEAMKLANGSLLRTRLNNAQSAAVKQHFTEGERWRR
jgi:hypothetical protein